MNYLKNLLQSNYLFVLILLTIPYVFFITNYNIYKSEYRGSEEKIKAYISDIDINGDNLKLVVKGKEKLIVYYKLKTEMEQQNFSDEYKIGDVIIISGNLESPENNRVFNLFNYRKYLLSQNIYWIFRASEIKKIANNTSILMNVKNYFMNRSNSIKYSSDYVKAFVLAKNDIDQEIKKSYQINGISHLLAISGAQISLFSIFILKILSYIKLSMKSKYIITTIIILIYLYITSVPASLLRAVLFFILLAIKRIYKLSIKSIHLLMLLTIFLLLYNPYYIYDLAFIFSFSISFYLLYFQNLIANFKNYITKNFVISIIAFLASIPTIVSNFFEINLLSPLINIVFIPIFSIILFPLSLLTFLFPVLDKILFFIINQTESISLFFSNFKMFNLIIPKINLLGIIIYNLIIFWILKSFMNKKYYTVIYILLVIILTKCLIYLNPYPIITMIDVSQGESILIQLPFNRGNILIDTGGLMNFKKDWQKRKEEYSLVESRTIPYLKSLGISKIDYLILTHGDYDHLGEASRLIDGFKIKHIIFNSGAINELEQKIIEQANYNKTQYSFFSKNDLIIDNYKFHFLNKINLKNENEDSLIIYTKLNNKNILFTGDSGIESEKNIMMEYNLPKMDILKIGHHGSKNSTSENFLNFLNPKYALISAGKNNRFNHPHQEVIELLDKYNVQYWTTSEVGSIKVIIKDKIEVLTCLL